MLRLTEKEQRQFAYYKNKKKLNCFQRRRFVKLVKKATSLPISTVYNSIQLGETISYHKPKTIFQRLIFKIFR